MQFTSAMQARRALRSARSAMTVIELVFSASIFALVLMSSLAMISRDTEFTRSSNGAALTETRAQVLLHSVVAQLEDAVASDPVTSLALTLASGATSNATVADTAGFPMTGRLLIDRGGAAVERCDYQSLALNGQSFIGLNRGTQCTQEGSHQPNSEVRWAAYAEALPAISQANPPAGSFDGQALVLGNTVAFKGDGTGFSFRVPVDPTNATPPDYLVDGQVQWGAAVNGVATTTGFSAISFVPRVLFDESVSGTDLNQDGDRVDIFDIGQLRQSMWDVTQPGILGDDLGLGPTILVQERCNWGGDLDGDGFDDPIFLWDSEARELSIRLFVLSETVPGLPIMRRVETLIYLRNPEV